MAADPVARLGGAAALAVAACYVATGVAAALMPPELQGRPDITPEQFWLVLSRDPGAHLAFHAFQAAAGLLALAAVPAIHRLVRPAQEGWALFASALAYLGFAVLARSHLMEMAFDRKIIAVYPEASPAFREAVHVVAGLALDVPDGFLTHGAIGVWMLAVCVLGRRAGALPGGLTALGVAAGVSQLLGVVGYTFLIRELLLVAIGLGGVGLVPAWLVWMGLRLRSGPG